MVSYAGYRYPMFTRIAKAEVLRPQLRQSMRKQEKYKNIKKIKTQKNIMQLNSMMYIKAHTDTLGYSVKSLLSLLIRSR